MSATRVVAKSVFTRKDIQRTSFTGISFIDIVTVTCTICSKWEESTHYIRVFSIATWNLEVYNNKYYIIPYSHDNCRKIFKLCPPLE